MDVHCPRPPVRASIFRLSANESGTWACWSASAFKHFCRIATFVRRPVVRSRRYSSFGTRLSSQARGHRDLHGVRVDISTDPRPLMRNDPSLGSCPLEPRLFLNRSSCAPSELSRWMFTVNGSDGSLEHHLSLCPHHSVSQASWAHSCSITVSEAALLGSPLSIHSMRQTQCRPSGLMCASLGSSAASWNRQGGDAVRLCVDSSDGVRVVSLLGQCGLFDRGLLVVCPSFAYPQAGAPQLLVVARVSFPKGSAVLVLAVSCTPSSRGSSASCCGRILSFPCSRQCLALGSRPLDLPASCSSAL